MQQSVFDKEPESFSDDSSKPLLFYKFPNNPRISPEAASSNTTVSTIPFMNSPESPELHSPETNEFDLKR